MKKDIITGEFFKTIGFSEGAEIGICLNIFNEHFTNADIEWVSLCFKNVLLDPHKNLSNEVMQNLALALIEKKKAEELNKEISLNKNVLPYEVFGNDLIEVGAHKQMETAMQLPVTVAGALMPDAHQGYGLPIGGVLATQNAVIPYGVGVDIGCRMALSIFDIPIQYFEENNSMFKRELIAFTKFGAGAGWPKKYKAEHEVLDDILFSENKLIASLKDKAASQLGTSGGGNHFVEFGIINFEQDDEPLNIKAGKYLALLSHSGSRGLGATIANHYTKLAKQICKLPKEASNLAYMGLDTPEGNDYWNAMNLAGKYASACHEIIHKRLTQAIGATTLARVENHHNFAWKELYKGQPVITHRKGATPASKDSLGIIPGSMTANGYLVRGIGNDKSINSASHGAGRQMSRTQAEKTFSKSDLKSILNDYGVTLIGAGLDEVPMAYKDIEAVMLEQKELVQTVASFTPKMVRMAEDGSRED